ncbi:conserved protein of unknown function [Burkholderia multivorans]
MTDLPNPLTPADCNLRGLPWMSLDVQRVIDSDLFGMSTGDEFKVAFRLWAKSWHQVPAASLPNDERMLAHLAGLSEAPTKWKKVRAMALRGWILCSDNRLYHPVIAEKAIEAMQRADDYADRAENEQSRQQRHRDRRKAMFELLRQHDIVPAWDTKTPELERLVALLPKPKPETPRVTPETESVTGGVTGGTSHGVARDAPATAITAQDTTVNRTKGGSGTAQVVAGDVPADDQSSAAAAFVEILRREGVSVVASDERIVSWPLRGATREDVVTALATARRRRAKDNSTQSVNVGLLDSILNDAIAARSATIGGQPRTVGDWWRSWAGIVEHGRTLGVEQGTDEPPFEFKLRVFDEAGDGPWWDDHNRAFRNTAGLIAAGAMLGEGR